MADARVLKIYAGKVIAIDGPAGSGKSTIARRIAAALGFTYLDTGAMYRATAWIANEKKLDLTDQDNLHQLLVGWDVRLIVEEGKNKVYFGEEEITEAIRSAAVTARVSEVAAEPIIREFLVAVQRKYLKSGSVVLEGRDTGTVVAPRADVKIYLDAEMKTRAMRRMLEYIQDGKDTTLEEQTKKMSYRDQQDLNRAVGPLKKAPDAVVIDTTELNIEEVTDKVLRVCKARMSGAKAGSGK